VPMFMVVYDVGDNTRRQKLAQTLARWGLRRIQRSAFVGSLTEARARDIARYCEMLIDRSSDVVHIVPLDRNSWRRAIVVGTSRWSAGAPERAVLFG